MSEIALFIAEACAGWWICANAFKNAGHAGTASKSIAWFALAIIFGAIGSYVTMLSLLKLS